MNKRGPYPSPVTTPIGPIATLMNHIDKHTNMTQVEVFEKAGYDASGLYRYRYGGDMKVKTLCDVAKVVGLEVVLLIIE